MIFMHWQNHHEPRRSRTHALNVRSRVGSNTQPHTHARTIKWHAYFHAGSMRWHGHGCAHRNTSFPCSYWHESCSALHAHTRLSRSRTQYMETLYINGACSSICHPLHVCRQVNAKASHIFVTLCTTAFSHSFARFFPENDPNRFADYQNIWRNCRPVYFLSDNLTALVVPLFPDQQWLTYLFIKMVTNIENIIQAVISCFLFIFTIAPLLTFRLLWCAEAAAAKVPCSRARWQ